MANYNLVNQDVIKWAESYKGLPFMAIMCDPPYHLTTPRRFGKPGAAPAKFGTDGAFQRASKGMMGQVWDGVDSDGLGIAFRPETWAALSQHLHPGGFIVAFAGTRGYHRMACAMEDSGLIIHPAMVWTFLSGFPKATKLSNQIDRDAGEEAEIISYRNANRDGSIRTPGVYEGIAKQGKNGLAGKKTGGLTPVEQPATALAQTWAGHRYGLQALKPALEFIAVAQKPYGGRPVDCITRTGAGAWNIDLARIPLNGEDNPTGSGTCTGTINFKSGSKGNDGNETSDLGRWPANLLLDEAGAALLDRQSGESVSSGGVGLGNLRGFYKGGFTGDAPSESSGGYGDSGGASRMFFQSTWQYEILEQLENADPLKYEPKVSTAEREAGLDSLPLQTRNRVNSGGYEADPKFAPTQMKNNHPTLKPISLTKYLATLILPPDAYAPRRICVPFGGAGSEAIGCVLAGWESVTVIESSPDYVPIADARLAWWSQWPGWGQTDVDKILASIEPKEETPQATQLSLLPDEDTQARILKALEAK